MIINITTITVMNIVVVVVDVEVDDKFVVKNDSVEYVMSTSAFHSLYKDSVISVEQNKVGVTSVIFTGMVIFVLEYVPVLVGLIFLIVVSAEKIRSVLNVNNDTDVNNVYIQVGDHMKSFSTNKYFTIDFIKKFLKSLQVLK